MVIEIPATIRRNTCDNSSHTPHRKLVCWIDGVLVCWSVGCKSGKNLFYILSLLFPTGIKQDSFFSLLHYSITPILRIQLTSAFDKKSRQLQITNSRDLLRSSSFLEAFWFLDNRSQRFSDQSPHHSHFWHSQRIPTHL